MYAAAVAGDLEQVTLLVEQGEDKNQGGGGYDDTPLSIAARGGYLDVVRYLVEQGADMEKADSYGRTPLINASFDGQLEATRYLLEQGANRDKADNNGATSLHYAACHGHLEIVKLLMVYGADLKAEDNYNQLPIDMGYLNNEEIKQAIRDEPRRRLDEAPGKRAIEQDRHPNAATSAFAQRQEEDEEEQGDEENPAEIAKLVGMIRVIYDILLTKDEVERRVSCVPQFDLYDEETHMAPSPLIFEQDG